MSVESSTSFLELLSRYRLLEPTQLDEVERTLVPRLAEPKALGRELLKRGWLTAFQVNQLLQGRAQDLVLGSYVLLERLGEGGMGAVYKARHAKLGRTVAVKVIRKERLTKGDAVRRFQREIRAAAQLHHPNIVRAYDADDVDGTHLLAMELVEGAVDLAKLVKERGPLPVADACEYIRQAALGLQHAFERGMVHRDIKPQNLLLTFSREPQASASSVPREGATIAGSASSALAQGSRLNGVVKILDMGLARLGDDDKGENSTSTLTQEGAVMGTLDYIAPEQARDSHTVDIRADLYSLGCTLFFLLTGRVPFPGGTAAQKLMKHQLDAPPWVSSLRSEVPEIISGIVAKLMAKRQEDRFQTPIELAAALANPTVMVATGSLSLAAGRGNVTPTRNVFADLGAGDTVVAESTPAPEPIKSPPRPIPWKWLAVGGGGAASLMVLLLMFLNGRSVNSTPNQDGEVKHPKGQKGSVVEPQATLDPDRKAAEWVLSVGGNIKIKENGKEREIKAVGDLPPEVFQLAFVDLAHNEKVTDAGLAHFKDCKNLTALELGNTPVRDAGLAHFKDCKNLTNLDLSSTKVSDAGLAYFADCKNLVALVLDGTQVGDAGLAHFKDCKNLMRLSLGETKVTDSGLAHFKDCKKLTALILTATQVSDAGLVHFTDCKNFTSLILGNIRVSDAGLAHFKDCKILSYLYLNDTSISDAGLAHFKNCEDLSYLYLHGTKVGDAGLVHIKNCKKLTVLILNKTKVTAAGVKKLAAALPGCKFVWDGGVIEPLPVDPPGNYALTFDGKGLVRVDVNPAVQARKFTVEAWAMAEGPGMAAEQAGNLYRNALHSKAAVVGGALSLQYGQEKDGSWRWKWVAVNSQTRHNVVSKEICEFGKWAHVAGVYDGKSLTLFVNGRQQGSNPAIGNDLSFEVAPFQMGDLGGTRGTFVGKISAWRLSKTARYDKDFTPAARFEPDADTLALYRFDEGQGDKLKDSSGNGHHGKIVGAKWVKLDGAPLGSSFKSFTNSLGMEFVLVPKGKSWLGGGGGKPGMKEVEIDHDFYLGKYEVTQEEWEKVMGNNPSHFSRIGKGKEVVKDVPDADLKRFPVEWVSWNEAEEFIKRVNDNVRDAGWVYRLPKLVEWEYACRGGPRSDKADSGFDYYVAKPTNDYQVLKSLANYNGLNRTCKVGSYPPNRLGLHDMHGNVWEWCSDELPPDAKGFPQRAFRGGGVHGLEGRCRAATHITIPGLERDYDVGLRLARVPVSKDAK